MSEQTFTSRLRDLADWLEKNDYPTPEKITAKEVQFDIGYSKDMSERLRYFTTLFGASEKKTDDYLFTLTKKEPVAGFILYTHTVKSYVCEKREYEETEEGDGYTITRKVVEHKCAHSILAGASS